jgi:hypothetical protein
MDSNCQSELKMPEINRSYFAFRLEQIPGKPRAQSLTIAHEFMQHNFGRNFSWEEDYVYTPPNICDESGKARVLLNINAKIGPKPTKKIRCFNISAVNNSLYGLTAPNTS